MKKPSDTEISNTALRIGMICGLLVGVNPDACKHLIKNAEGDFRYIKETEAVLALQKKLGFSGLGIGFGR